VISTKARDKTLFFAIFCYFSLVHRSPERVAYQRIVRSGKALEDLTWADMGRQVEGMYAERPP
jgi:hypothetical protein